MKVVTILSTATESDWCDLSTSSPCALVFPAAMTGTTVTLQADPGDGTGRTLSQKNGGGDYTVTVDVGQWVPLDPQVIKAVRRVRVVSASAEAADRVIGIVPDVLA